MCVTVVRWSRSCLNVKINRVLLPATRFSVSLYRFFFFLLFGLFFQHYFSFWPVFLYSYCWPCWSCTRINNIFWSPEFYFGKGISKARDLHTGQAYDQKKKKKKIKTSIKTSRHVHPLKQLIFFSVLVDIMTNNTQYTTNCVSFVQHPPVTNWRNLNLPFEHRLNHQYHYAKISTGFAPKN